MRLYDLHQIASLDNAMQCNTMQHIPLHSSLGEIDHHTLKIQFFLKFLCPPVLSKEAFRWQTKTKRPQILHHGKGTLTPRETRRRKQWQNDDARYKKGDEPGPQTVSREVERASFVWGGVASPVVRPMAPLAGAALQLVPLGPQLGELPAAVVGAAHPVVRLRPRQALCVTSMGFF